MKKYISVMVSAAVCLSSLPFCVNAFSFIDEENERWDGTSDILWYNEAETTFSITTPEELAGLAELVNGGNSFEGKTVNLEADIYINDYIKVETDWGSKTELSSFMWTPIGMDTPFSGIFNGNGYMVHGLKTENCENSGLFGMLDSAVIKNVILEEGTVNGTSKSGGICGYAVGTQFINCTNGAEISAYSEENSVFAGGIAGFADDSVFDNCSNYVIIKSESVSGESYAGGIAGIAQGTEFVICENLGIGGMLVKSEEKNVYGGGICGFGAKSIRQCVNEAIVGGISAQKTTYAGGLIGLGTCRDDFTEISESMNSGSAVASKSAAGFAGGISGKGGTITDCVNSGAVGAVQGNADCYIGGIAGSMAYLGNCVNFGAVVKSSDSEVGSDSENALVLGGLIGDSASSELVNSYYLETAAEYASGSDTSIIASKTEEELLSAEFAELMGEKYIYCEGGIPVPVCCYAPVAGDINSDGTIDSIDAVLLRKGLTEGFGTISQRMAADVTENKVKNANDLQCVRDYILGERNDFDSVYESSGSNNFFT
ncbi:MAG: hypothetical protein E7497_04990 [Ruminococcus sp.]|nr:hypothetical protein [Ruminococcus sp.]